MKNTEIELKFPLKNATELMEELNEIAEKEKETFQKDIYFIPPHKNFLEQTPIKEWLRIRETKEGCSVNYKNWHITEEEKEVVSCDEFETDIKDSEILKKIFSNLDFKEIIIVEKIRKDWKYKDALISIDNVKGLGDFIEIESRGEFNSVEEARENLHKIIKELNAEIGEEDFRGYPHMLLEKQGVFD